ncbi:MAG: hypothetical protein J3Q66DRAFT_392761 [Benniella sp.]|nr:MAG: hypothetical protein J3Q66DRAFT_392761 [Benniella sp.]
MPDVNLTPLLTIMLLSTAAVSVIMLYCYRKKMDRRERRRQRQLQQQNVSTLQFHYFNSSEEDLHRQSSSSNYTQKVGDHVAIAMDHPFGHQGVHVLKNNTMGGASDQNDDIHAEGSLYHRQPNIAGAHRDHLPSERNFNRKLSSPSPSSEHPQYPELTAPPPSHQGGSGRKYDLIILSTPLQHMQKQRQKEKKKKMEKEKEKELERERKMKQPAVPVRNDLPNRLAGAPPSPLPRPLNVHRPVIVDSTVTSSSKIVASIGDPAKTRSASSPTFETTTGPSKTRPRAKTIANNRPQPIQDPLSPKKSKEEESYIGKEELHRKPPQTILPEGYKPPQFTDVVVPVNPGTTETTYEAPTSNSHNVVDDGGLMSNELDTAYLVLEPYLPPNHEMPALKKKTPPTPTTPTSASTSSAASSATPKPANGPQRDPSNPTTAAIATLPYLPSPSVPTVPSPLPQPRSSSSSSTFSPPTDLPLSSSTLTSSPYQMQTPSDVPFVSLDSPKVPHRHPRIRAISPTLSTLSDASNSSWSTAMTASTATSTATTVSYPGSASGPSYVVTYPGCVTAMSDPSYQQQQQQQQQQRQQAPLGAPETASTLSLLVSLNAMPSVSSKQKQRQQQQQQQQNPYSARDVDMDQTSPLSATFYSPATPTSAKTPTSAGPRPLGPKTPPSHHQQRQQRQPKHNYQDTLEEAELSDSGSINRRTNNPQAPGGHGASFSIFNFES